MKWISVEDRLPDIGVPVWCYCFEDYEQRGYYEKTTEYSDGPAHLFKNDYDYNGYLSVTHWMPLPEPPEDK